MQKIITVGSAHLDIIAQPLISSKGKDVPGKVSIAVGGTGYNIACNLGCLQIPTVLHTALPNSTLAEIILAKPRKLKVETQVAPTVSDEVGGFSVHLDLQGELKSAITDCPIANNHLYSPTLERDILSNNIIVADCNLSYLDMEDILNLASDAGKFSVVAAVSEDKVVSVKDLLHKASLLFLNYRELDSLLDSLGFYEVNPLVEVKPNCGYIHWIELRGAIYHITEISQYVGCSLVVTDGDKGVFVSSFTSSAYFMAPKIDKSVNFLGMGDLLLSYILKYCYDNGTSFDTLKHGVRQALPMLVEVANNQFCSLGGGLGLDQEIAALQRLAYIDPLTGLLNRRGLDHEMESKTFQAAIRKGSLSVIAFDLDHFKHVNDSYGHKAGDMVLMAVANIAKGIIREHDLLVRTGGEEFLIVLPNETKGIAMTVAERIRLTIEATDIHYVDSKHDTSIKVTTSMGIAELCVDANNFLDLLQKADEYLYFAKESGRNRLCCFQKL